MLRRTTEDAGRIELWTVDRPRQANALDTTTLGMLEEAVTEAEARLARRELLRGVILLAAPRESGRPVFLSGADLKEVAALAVTGDAERARAFAVRVSSTLARLERLGCLVVAAIDGDVFGGGCEVVIACDSRIAEAGIELSFRQTRMGLTTGWGGTTRLARLVSFGAAKRLLLTGAPCKAEEALRLGLVDEVVPVGTAKARALELVRVSAQGAPHAIAELKRGLLEAREGTPEERETRETRELDRFVASWAHDDHREALAALREKRPARWTLT